MISNAYKVFVKPAVLAGQLIETLKLNIIRDLAPVLLVERCKGNITNEEILLMNDLALVVDDDHDVDNNNDDNCESVGMTNDDSA